MASAADIGGEATNLRKRIKDQIKLIRALANFHIDEEFSNPAHALVNQRSQLLKCIDALEQDFETYDTQRQANHSAVQAGPPEPARVSGPDVMTAFIEAVVPEEQQAAWDANSFTGSLLVFFEDGRVESSSLVAKQRQRVPTSNSYAHERHKKRIRVVGEPESEMFTVLKSLGDSNINFYFYLAEPARVVIKIYNQMDQLVRLIEKRYDAPGDYAITWDCRDNDGDLLAKGAYYCQLQVGNSLSELKTIELS